MLSSYRWIRALLGEENCPDVHAMARKLTAAGLEIEGVRRVGEHLAPVQLAKVVSIRPHPAGKNRLVTIDLGSESLEVVCGASNVPDPGGFVLFAPLGTTVFDRKGQPFVLQPRTIGGVESRGMLCAEDELGLGTGHEGIVVLHSADDFRGWWSNGAALRPGAHLLEYAPELDDWILEVNVTPNRPDALGHRGIARDVAALFGLRAPTAENPAPPSNNEALDVSITIEAPALCHQYIGAVLRDVRVGPSPLRVRVLLERLGVRAISNTVDVTNLVMLEYGQPMHAFAFDALQGSKIIVRKANSGEKLQTLDGVERELSTDDLVIADEKAPVAIAGVMGGEKSGVQNSTSKLLLEAAWFDPRSVRRTAQRHKLHSESSHRFEREVDPTGVLPAMHRAIAGLVHLAGAVPVGAPLAVVAQAYTPRTVSLRIARIERLLGYAVEPSKAIAALTALGFACKATDAALQVTVPGHRPDVREEIDLIEELARTIGYEHIPTVKPSTSGARAGARRDFWLRRRVREVCAALGLDEAVNPAFANAKDLERCGCGNLPTVTIANPLSADRGLLRPALLPGLLRAVERTHRHGEPRARLFEVATVFAPGKPGSPHGPTEEDTHLAAVLLGPRDAWLERPKSVDFFDAKGLVEELLQSVAGIAGRYEVPSDPPPWAHPRACAALYVEGMDGCIGYVGELHPDVLEALALPRGVVAFELQLAALGINRGLPVARAPGKFPSMRRDVSFLLERAHPAGAVQQVLREAAGTLCARCEPFDRYEGKELPEGTHALAFTLWFRSDERTLTDAEVDEASEKAVKVAEEKFHARRR